MPEREFIEECKEWLEPYGYSVHSYSGDRNSVTMVNHEDQKSPTIFCFKKEQEKRIKISDNMSFRMFLSLQSGEMQFKHPDIERYINVFRHYADMAIRSGNPF